MTFTNTVPGRNSQALQGFAVDGRKVAADASFRRRFAARTSAPARTPQQLPGIIIGFYDENRPLLGPGGEAGLGPWHGTFNWQSETKRISVPAEGPRGHHAHRPARRSGQNLLRRDRVEAGKEVGTGLSQFSCQ